MQDREELGIDKVDPQKAGELAPAAPESPYSFHPSPPELPPLGNEELVKAFVMARAKRAQELEAAFISGKITPQDKYELIELTGKIIYLAERHPAGTKMLKQEPQRWVEMFTDKLLTYLGVTEAVPSPDALPPAKAREVPPEDQEARLRSQGWLDPEQAKTLETKVSQSLQAARELKTRLGAQANELSTFRTAFETEQRDRLSAGQRLKEAEEQIRKLQQELAGLQQAESGEKAKEPADEKKPVDPAAEAGSGWRLRAEGGVLVDSASGKRYPNIEPFRKFKDEPGHMPSELILMGEFGQEEMPVLFNFEAMDEAVKFFQENSYPADGRTLESAGMLFGHKKKDEQSGIEWVEVSYFLPLPDKLLGGKRTSTSVTFTPDSWGYANQVQDAIGEMLKDDQLQMIGWAHSHPELNTFLSRDDQFIHNNYFTRGESLALVIDPRERTDLTPKARFFSRKGKGREQGASGIFEQKAFWRVSGEAVPKVYSAEDLLEIDEVKQIYEQITLLDKEPKKETSAEVDFGQKAKRYQEIVREIKELLDKDGEIVRARDLEGEDKARYLALAKEQLELDALFETHFGGKNPDGLFYRAFADLGAERDIREVALLRVNEFILIRAVKQFYDFGIESVSGWSFEELYNKITEPMKKMGLVPKMTLEEFIVEFKKVGETGGAGAGEAVKKAAETTKPEQELTAGEWLKKANRKIRDKIKPNGVRFLEEGSIISLGSPTAKEGAVFVEIKRGNQVGGTEGFVAQIFAAISSSGKVEELVKPLEFNLKPDQKLPVGCLDNENYQLKLKDGLEIGIQGISRQHLDLIATGEGVVLHNRQPRNGTYILRYGREDVPEYEKDQVFGESRIETRESKATGCTSTSLQRDLLAQREDGVFMGQDWFVLADGMGGEGGGEAAVAAAVSGFAEVMGIKTELAGLSEEEAFQQIRLAFERANEKISLMNGYIENPQAGCPAVCGIMLGDKDGKRKFGYGITGDVTLGVRRKDGKIESFSSDYLRKRAEGIANKDHQGKATAEQIELQYQRDRHITPAALQGKKEDLQSVRYGSIELEEGDTVFAGSDGIFDTFEGAGRDNQAMGYLIGVGIGKGLSGEVIARQAVKWITQAQEASDKQVTAKKVGNKDGESYSLRGYGYLLTEKNLGAYRVNHPQLGGMYPGKDDDQSLVLVEVGKGKNFS